MSLKHSNDARIEQLRAEVLRLSVTLAITYDTLRAVHAVTGQDEPYPFKPGGALRDQMAVDLEVIEHTLSMTPEQITAVAEEHAGDDR